MSQPALENVFPHRWSAGRVDWMMSESRRSVDPAEEFIGPVFLYSIPAIQETGDGQKIDAQQIGSTKLLISEPTLLVSKLNPRKAVVVAVRPRGVPTVCSSEFICLRPRDCVLRFGRYLFLSEHVRQHLESLVKSATRSHQRVQPSDVTKLWLKWPSKDEQRAIADFLDRETEKIDTLIEKKQRLLELLDEKRIALITQAVTRGLDPDVPMKDSGVEWLGEIPVHWDVARVKHVARLESGHTPDRKVPEYWNGGVAWLSLADTKRLKREDVIEETTYEISAEGLANSSARVLPARTVAFSRDATIGLCAILRRPMAVSQHFIAWVCKPLILPEYLLLVFGSMSQELDRLTMGATIRTLGLPEVGGLKTPLPLVAEQERIVSFCHEQTEHLDQLSDRLDHAISLLQEYRTALISAAVTGQIDVREKTPA